MPAVSKKQQKFFGIVRAIQKGEQAPTTPETAKAAADMKKSDVKKFASTKHKGLPNKVVQKEEDNFSQKNTELKRTKSARDQRFKTLHKGTNTSSNTDVNEMVTKEESNIYNEESFDKPKKKVSEAMNFSKFKARAMDAAKKAVAKKSVAKKSSSSYVGKRDAGAIAAKRMRDKEQQKYVGFLPANESVSEAKVEGGYISNVAKAQARNERRFGDKGSTEPTGRTGQGTSSSAKMAVKRGEEHKARRGVKTKGMSEGSVEEAVYTGPDKKDRALIKKMYDRKGNPSDYAKRLEKYKKDNPEKVKKIQDKVDKSMKITREGTSYGLYKGSGKPSGAMAAFSKKDTDKKKREVKKEEVQSSVWPSTYASGSKKEKFSDWKSEFIWEDGDSAHKK